MTYLVVGLFTALLACLWVLVDSDLQGDHLQKHEESE